MTHLPDLERIAQREIADVTKLYQRTQEKFIHDTDLPCDFYVFKDTVAHAKTWVEKIDICKQHYNSLLNRYYRG